MSVTTSIENKFMNELDLLLTEQKSCTDKQRNFEIDIEIQKVWNKIDRLDEWVYGCLVNRGIYR